MSLRDDVKAQRAALMTIQTDLEHDITMMGPDDGGPVSRREFYTGAVAQMEIPGQILEVVQRAVDRG